MNDRELMKAMDAWAAQEAASAPEMRPTAEMVRLVRAKQERKPVPLLGTRWALAGLAMILVVASVLLYAAFGRPAFLFRPATQQVAHVGQRAGPGDDTKIVIRTPEPQGKGGDKGAAFFARFLLELDRAGAARVVGTDLRAVQNETVSLTAADNYRLFLEPARTCTLYVYQYTDSGTLVQLFPGETYTVIQNPLAPGQKVYLPSEPNWLYVGEHRGQDRLYVLASGQPLHDLEATYTQYVQAGDVSSKQEALDRLLERLDAAGTARSQGMSQWLIVLNHSVQN
jgi:hypothetical protein